MGPRKNRCDNCNAPLVEGTSFCSYCDLGPDGLPRARPKASSGSTRRGSIGRFLKIGLGVVGLTCCAPLGVFGWLNETVYSIEMDAPKYSARAPSVEQRPAEPITPMQVVQDMRGAPDLSLSQRKQQWREKYEGRWVSWTGVVAEVRPYEAFASELVLRSSDEGQGSEVEVNIDPLHNAVLKQLQKGQAVRVSGRLWGYYFLDDTVRLSEGVLVEVAAPPTLGQR